MPYASDRSDQISASRALALHVRQLAAVLSLNDDRARLISHAEELERHADAEEREQAAKRATPPLHLAQPPTRL